MINFDIVLSRTIIFTLFEWKQREKENEIARKAE